MDNQIPNTPQNSATPPGQSNDALQTPVQPQQPAGKKKYAKIVPILVALLFILAGSAFGYQHYVASQDTQTTLAPSSRPVSPTTTPAQKWNVYEDTINGYSFEYPPPYTQNQFGIATTDAMTLITPIFSPDTIDETINMIQKPHSGQESTYKTSKETINGFQVIKTEVTTHFTEYGSEDRSNDRYYYYVYIALAPKKTLILSSSLKYKHIIDQIIPTVKVN